MFAKWLLKHLDTKMPTLELYMFEQDEEDVGIAEALHHTSTRLVGLREGRN